MNKSNIFVVLGIVLFGVLVSRLKYEVLFLRKHHDKLAAEILNYKEEIKVMNAEWCFLNNTDRLKKLSMKYLPDMRPLENSQLVTYASFREKAQNIGNDKEFSTENLATSRSNKLFDEANISQPKIFKKEVTKKSKSKAMASMLDEAMSN